MEWMNRSTRPASANGQPAGGAPTGPTHHQDKAAKLSGMRWVSVSLLFSASILVLALLALLIFGPDKQQTQAKHVDTKQMQAVFLNGGQVYFGNIRTLNNQYLRLSNIYYLRVNQQVQPDGSAAANSGQDISLVKLGCELHGPQDQMVINQSQVIFWENLKADGQVAKAVADYIKQNPNGQQCNTNANSNGQSTNTNTQSNTTQQSTTTNKTNTTTPTTKKP